ncbi:MAG: hypothetical protein R2854_29560 [Caldilineaceae bacterium]
MHLVVVIGPSLAAFYYSLTDWSGVGAAEFIGLENFRILFFEDDTFRQAFSRNMLWLCFFLTVPFILALAAATLLVPIGSAMAFRTSLFLPYILPSVITVAIWRSLLSPRMGVEALTGRHGHPRTGSSPIWARRAPRSLTIAFVDNWHFYRAS